MKLLFLTINVLFFNSLCLFGQVTREKKVILFNKKEMSFNNNIFNINGTTFKYFKEKKRIKFDTVQKFFSNLNEMNSYIEKSNIYDSKKNVSFYYSTFYDLYIFINENNKSGFLYPVERIWIVDGKIID